MQASGPYRLTAAFGEYYDQEKTKSGENNVLFMPQWFIMRGRCAYESTRDGEIDCKQGKRVRVNGEWRRIKVTSEHRATELWKDWSQDRRRLFNNSIGTS